MKDWRITNQESFLMGKSLRKANFEPKNTKWDHEHCAFCWEKITVCACGGNVAYVTQDGEWWICENCYNDFKDLFGWSVEDG